MSATMLGVTISALAGVLVAAWVVLLVAAARVAREGGSSAGAVNAGMLLATLVASLGTCAAPVVPLVAAFGEVANARPEEKAGLLERAIAADRPFMLLALLAIPILVAGASAFAANRRRYPRRNTFPSAASARSSSSGGTTVKQSRTNVP